MNANMTLIMQELNKIEQQYIILATQYNAYSMPDKVKNIRVKDIERSMDNSVELLVVNQSILNTRELLFYNAIDQGCTEYLGCTQEDSKVRETHWLYYQDKWIKFDKLPKIGHVGTEINCRCFAQSFR